MATPNPDPRTASRTFYVCGKHGIISEVGVETDVMGRDRVGFHKREWNCSAQIHMETFWLKPPS